MITVRMTNPSTGYSEAVYTAADTASVANAVLAFASQQNIRPSLVDFVLEATHP